MNLLYVRNIESILLTLTRSVVAQSLSFDHINIAYPFHVSLAKHVDRYGGSYLKTSVNTSSMHSISLVLIFRHIFLHMCVIQISLKFHQHCYETRVAW